MFETYNRLINLKHTENEAAAENEIKAYVKKKYNAEIYICDFLYNENGCLFLVNIYLRTNEERISIIRHGDRFYDSIPEDNKVYYKILSKNGIKMISSILNRIDNYVSGIGAYTSFEDFASLHLYQRSGAFGEIKNFLKRIYNPDTMERIGSSNLFVTYKSKELLEQAIVSGETERFKNELYDILKKYDVHGYVTHEKLFARFDSVETMLTPREYYNLFFDMASGFAFQDFYKIK